MIKSMKTCGLREDSGGEFKMAVPDSGANGRQPAPAASARLGGLDNFGNSSSNTRMSKKHKETVQKQFTKTAEAFSTFAMRDTPEVLKEKVDFAKPQSTDIALDVACGPGAFALALAPRVHSVQGVEL